MPVVGITEGDLAELGAPSEFASTFRLVSAGRLLGWKGFHFVLLALAELGEEAAGCEYWIFGDGPEWNRLHNMVERFGLQRQVRLVRRVTRSELLARLPEFHAMVHPSLHESGGFVCLEAMASGCPVICLDLGGPAVQVDRTCGFTVSADNPHEAIAGIAAAIRRLRREPGLHSRLSAGAKARVACDLSTARYMRMLVSFYGVMEHSEQAQSTVTAESLR
jgi:glycosyltransferase involved in cell wall biosynthesis